MELFLKKKDIRYGSKIQESKGLSGTAAWPMAQKNIVQVTFVRWRGDSKIVEANAEHDFRLKRLIGMPRTMERAQYFFVPSARRQCRTDLGFSFPISVLGCRQIQICLNRLYNVQKHSLR